MPRTRRVTPSSHAVGRTAVMFRSSGDVNAGRDRPGPHVRAVPGRSGGTADSACAAGGAGLLVPVRDRRTGTPGGGAHACRFRFVDHDVGVSPFGPAAGTRHRILRP